MDVKDKIEIKRHEEMIAAMSKVSNAISNPKEDAELKKLLSDNKEAISKFVNALSDLKKQDGRPEIKVETNQDKVIEAIESLGEIMKGLGERLTAIEEKEQRPLPVKLKAERNKWGGEIDYVIIEYKK